MRHVILGTAGHIDHGKSSLVKCMTGVDPDRLKEEKERGITIDLGFAELKYDDGLSVGIVDVPGHERLVKNMLAGAGGIDMLLMVIAADEGIMPQSREHLHICKLLKIKTGIVAITKADLVEPEWLELVTQEVAQFVSGSFLEDAPVIAVSSTTKQNIQSLVETIHGIALGIEPKPSGGLFRMPVDRVFTLKGFGTVVTGTAVSGSVDIEDQVEVLPSGIKTRVRGLHCHGQAVKRIQAGQRGAMNLQGVEKDDLSRGDSVVSAGRFSPTLRVDAVVELLEGAAEVKNRSLVHFHQGTSETVARLVLYGPDKLSPGQKTYCQLRLQDPVISQAGDRFIIRRFSPLETIGGGLVLDSSPGRRRKKDGIADLELFDSGDLRARILEKIGKSALSGMTRADIEGWIHADIAEIRDAVGSLKGEGRIIKIEDILIHRDAFEAFRHRLAELLRVYHDDNPMKRGMPKEEARVRLRVTQKIFNGLVSIVDDVRGEKDLLSLRGFSAAANDEDRQRIVDELEKRNFEPPMISELSAELGMNEKALADILKLLDSEKRIIRLSGTLYMGKESYARMLKILHDHFALKGDVTVAEFRDILGTTRKYALPLLEHLDSSGVTLRVGDVRKLLSK